MEALGKMRASATNSGSWNTSGRRAWCNDNYANAVKSVMGNIFKIFNCITATEYNATTTTTTEDIFALPAAKEVWGGTTQTVGGSNTTYSSNVTEFNTLIQFNYYKTSVNRTKKLGNTTTSGRRGAGRARPPRRFFSFLLTRKTNIL